MEENLIHYRTSVCNINCHMVWSVKYRRKVLTAEKEAFLRELVQEIAEDKGFTVHLFECGECDRVHFLVSGPPKLSTKGIRLIRQEESWTSQRSPLSDGASEAQAKKAADRNEDCIKTWEISGMPMWF